MQQETVPCVVVQIKNGRRFLTGTFHSALWKMYHLSRDVSAITHIILSCLKMSVRALENTAMAIKGRREKLTDIEFATGRPRRFVVKLEKSNTFTSVYSFMIAPGTRWISFISFLPVTRRIGYRFYERNKNDAGMFTNSGIENSFLLYDEIRSTWPNIVNRFLLIVNGRWYK